MDPSEPGDRCLPEMGLSGWMKRTMERSYDLSEFCNSPPADGFFYSRQKGNNAGVAGKGICLADSGKKEEVRSCNTIMGGVLAVNQPGSRHLTHTLSDPSMYHHHHSPTSEVSPSSGMLVSGFSATAFSKQLTLGLNPQSIMSSSDLSPEENQMRMNSASTEDLSGWGSSSDGQDRFPGDLIQSHPADDSAPTPVDNIMSSQYTPTIMTTPADEGRSVRLVDKLGAGNLSCPPTPDVTPAVTPTVTPSCSPMVARRTGNPFFTGGGADDERKSGSWLFRPGKKAADGTSFHSDKLYETKVEFQAQPNSKVAKKTVRYVPRPSELRELNFWSPTSM